jgi:molecular chaperone GrpE
MVRRRTGEGSMNDDRTDDTGKHGSFRVVDRRHWVDDAETTGQEASSQAPDKPTYVAELEALLADRERRLREIGEVHQGSLDDLDAARERIRREAARELEQHRRQLLADLLDVLDDLDRAMGAAAETRDPRILLDGVQLIRERVLGRLEQLGVSRLEVLGQRFDPRRHEAMAMLPVEDPRADGTVVGVIREGYAIGEDVLRPAAVAVGQASGR